MDIQVECGPGPNGELEPRRLRLGTTPVEVVDVIDRWPAPGHRYFKVRGSDGGVYIVRHDPEAGTWQMTFYRGPEVEDASGDGRAPEGRS
jgi:hypothetical protein